MNLQTAIVEDSKPDAERLKQLLKKAFENENISCSCFASGDEFLRAGGREGYQVVFLDICMEGTNGIETAQRLRAADPDLLIVFVTSSPEYPSAAAHSAGSPRTQPERCRTRRRSAVKRAEPVPEYRCWHPCRSQHPEPPRRW